MQLYMHIAPPRDENDATGAQRVFEDFFAEYQPALQAAAAYLGTMISDMEPKYAVAYRPWLKAVKDLLHGVHFVARKIPLGSPERLGDALRTFSLESAIGMLHDVCISCKLKLGTAWAYAFQQNMQTLNLAFQVLLKNRALGLAR